MSAYRFDSAEQLYDLLPEVYRERDKDAPGTPSGGGDLRGYLESLGEVLDLARHTLEQRYDDSFPDNSVPGRRCQDWLLPYFADLFAVSLHSPYPEGQREEVANAVRWAQRKGTLLTIEEVIEAIVQSEGEIQEGWQRVATTARIGMPLLPAMALGEPAPMPPDAGSGNSTATPQQIARHPGLRAVTPDLRQNSRAVACDPGTPSSHVTLFGGNSIVWPQDDPDRASGDREFEKTHWRQSNPHGAPCFPGSYEDVSLRTVDIRDGTDGARPFHPKRIQIFLPPPFGICTPDPLQFQWSETLDTPQLNSSDPSPPLLSAYVERIDHGDGSVTFRNHSVKSVEIVGNVTLATNRRSRFEKLRFANDINLSDGFLELHRCAVRAIGSTAPAEPDIEKRRIHLRDSLINKITAAANIISLEYATILDRVKCRRLLASDTIFAGKIDGLNADDCVRFSRVPVAYLNAMPPIARNDGLTVAMPGFYSSTFGETGCAVLRQTADASLRFGAEDGTELGVHHAWRHIAQIEGLDAKLRDYLPIGLRPVITYDDRLLHKPPAVDNSPTP